MTDEQLSSFTVITTGPCCSSSDKKEYGILFMIKLFRLIFFFVKRNLETLTREQILYQSFSHRIEELFSEKVFAESKNISYLEEVSSIKLKKIIIG